MLLLLLFLVVVVVVPGCCLLVPVGACWCLLVPVGACCCCCCLCVCCVCACVVGVFKIFGPLPRTPSPPDRFSPGPPNISLFFFSPAGNFILLSLSWGSSRRILVVFEGRDPQMCTFGLSSCGGKGAEAHKQANRTHEQGGQSRHAGGTWALLGALLCPIFHVFDLVLGFGVQVFRVQGLGFGVWGLGFGGWGLGFGVWGLGFGVWGLGFGVWGLGFRV